MFATCIFRKGYGYLQSLWYSMPEPHRPAVGLYDLPHQFEAQAVLAALGAGDIRLPVQRIQPGGVHPHTVILYRAGASPSLRPYGNRDVASLGIVDHAVADQVVQHPPEKGGVTLPPGSAARMLLRKFNLILLR